MIVLRYMCSKYFSRIFDLSVLFLVAFILISCSYDRATFLYNNIAPSAPTDLKITATNSTSATITWDVADDQAYPTPTFSVFTILSNATSSTTNEALSIAEVTNRATIPNLTSATTYSAFIRSTNIAGHSDSSGVSFTTP